MATQPNCLQINKRVRQHFPLVSNKVGGGGEHEKDGVKSFLSDIASQHDGWIEGFHQCGLYVKCDHPYLAASPDGLFTCKCCDPATVEIRCPYSVRNDNIMEKDVYQHVDFLEEHDGSPCLKCSHKYFTQVQAPKYRLKCGYVV